jgi:hypothetical protein
MIAKPMFKLPLLALGALVLAAPAYAQKPDVKIEGEEEDAPQAIPSADTMKDWPCVQGKVETLSVTTIWDGPSLDDPAAKEGVRDTEISNLVRTLASRRVPIDKAEEAIKAFADKQAPDVRDKRLTQVFAALFDTVNNQRKTVITGIGKYQKSQRARSAELERQGTEIAKLEQQSSSDEKAAADLATAQEHFQWASRIFQERQQSIPLACELPVLIEERLYELAKSIRGLMKA